MPSPRFSSENQPEINTAGGRTPTSYIRRQLNQRGEYFGKTESMRDQIILRLIETATSQEIRIVGRGRDGEPIEVADMRAANEAAKILLAYDMGQPPKHEKKIGAFQLKPGQDLLGAAMDVYRLRLESGEMTDTEFGEMVKILLAIEREKAILFLKALGDKVKGLGDEKVATLMDAFGKDPQAFMSGQAQLPTIEIPTVDEEKFGGK